MSKEIAKAKVGLEGRFRLRVKKVDGSERLDTGWFDNVITDDGLNAFGGESYYSLVCVVGSGNSAPSTSDTSLDAFIARSSSPGTSAISTGRQADTQPYYAFVRKEYTFDAGDAEGNVSEVGVTWNSNSQGEDLFNRALILDAQDNPTTITILSDEILVVEYELRIYPDFDDQVSTVVDSGPAGTSHTVTMRVNYFTRWAGPRTSIAGIPFLDAGLGSLGDPMVENSPTDSGRITWYGNISVAPYVNNSHERVFTVSAGIDDLNDYDIEYLTFSIGDTATPTGRQTFWQASISPAIQKTDADKLTLTFKYSWSRR